MHCCSDARSHRLSDARSHRLADVESDIFSIACANKVSHKGSNVRSYAYADVQRDLHDGTAGDVRQHQRDLLGRHKWRCSLRVRRWLRLHGRGVWDMHRGADSRAHGLADTPTHGLPVVTADERALTCADGLSN